MFKRQIHSLTVFIYGKTCVRTCWLKYPDPLEGYPVKTSWPKLRMPKNSGGQNFARLLYYIACKVLGKRSFDLVKFWPLSVGREVLTPTRPD